jgi:hypothetical protein
MLKWLLISFALAVALNACLVVGPGVSGSGGGALIFSGEVTASDDYRVIVVPRAAVHYRGLRFEAQAYPIEVYRIVVVYRSGAQETFAVRWRFTGGVRYRDLRVGRDGDVREVRMYYRPLDDDRGNRGNRDDRGRDHGRGPGRTTITVYGIP